VNGPDIATTYCASTAENGYGRWIPDHIPFSDFFSLPCGERASREHRLSLRHESQGCGRAG